MLDAGWDETTTSSVELATFSFHPLDANRIWDSFLGSLRILFFLIVSIGTGLETIGGFYFFHPFHENGIGDFMSGELNASSTSGLATWNTTRRLPKRQSSIYSRQKRMMHTSLLVRCQLMAIKKCGCYFCQSAQILCNLHIEIGIIHVQKSGVFFPSIMFQFQFLENILCSIL